MFAQKEVRYDTHLHKADSQTHRYTAIDNIRLHIVTRKKNLFKRWPVTVLSQAILELIRTIQTIELKKQQAVQAV